jgi:hypothetical protein
LAITPATAYFHSERQVDHDACHHAGEREQTVGDQFLADLRADELDALQLHLGIFTLQCAHHLIALLGRGEAGLDRQTDQHVTRGAEVLHLGVRIAEFGECAAHRFERHRGRILHFDDRTAGELHRQMQPAMQQEEHGSNKRQQRDRVEHQCPLHER